MKLHLTVLNLRKHETRCFLFLEYVFDWHIDEPGPFQYGVLNMAFPETGVSPYYINVHLFWALLTLYIFDICDILFSAWHR